ncbi:TetR/AcrR family transcriptional regulator [Phytomonospora sp. NPDC050363]|uniref:TetR/AcrR family transcriptional regulator n=1 Tax=Phytomonospora sp. NPDC050363 TaxID=3155642 RepID=UPI00340E9F64
MTSTSAESTASAESPTRSRTRRAILTAAATVLARNRSATLAEIAEAAAVGRTTVHRYFADRDELIKATVADSITAIGDSILDARLEEGPAREAMHRLITAMVDTYEHMMFLWGEPAMLELIDPADNPDIADRSVRELIARGQAEGVFDPDVSVDWIQQTLWALTYTGGEAGAKGELPRHGVAATVIRTFERGLYRGN